MKKLVILPLLVCFFGLRAEPHAAETQVRFPLVYGAMSGNTVPLWLAKEQGFFRKYGLDPQLIFIIAGRAAPNLGKRVPVVPIVQIVQDVPTVQIVPLPATPRAYLLSKS